jgi:hypothetical protein
MNWTSEWFVDTDEPSIDHLAEQAVRIFLYGVGAVPPAHTPAFES